MGELSSKLFTEGDPAVVKKLEDCATGSPSEVLSHFARGQEGEHIRRVQQALKNAAELDPDLGIPNFDVNGKYDDNFAKAIAVYKEKKQILNFAKKVDDIVGIKTIHELDKEAKKKRRGEPAPRPSKDEVQPRPLANCVPDVDCPTSKEFEVKLLMGLSGGEVVEAAKFLFAIRDTANGLSAIYEFQGGGIGAGATPITPAVAGTKKGFHTDHAVRVTRFGPVATIIGATAPNPFSNFGASVTFVSFSYRPDGVRGLPQTKQIPIDGGIFSVPGASAHIGKFTIKTVCQGQSGASRRELGLQDTGGLR